MSFEYDDIQSLAVSLPEDIEKRKWAGDFDGAIALCRSWIANEKVPEILKKKLAIEVEILKEMPLEYPYTREEVIAEIRESVPDFTEEEFTKLLYESRIDFIFIKGVEHYHEDCVSTLFHVNKDLIERRAKNEISKSTDGISSEKTDGRTGTARTETTQTGTVQISAGKTDVGSGIEPEQTKSKEDIAFDEIRAKMIKDGSAMVRFRLRAECKISDEAFTKGHVKVYFPIPGLCPQTHGMKIIDGTAYSCADNTDKISGGSEGSCDQTECRCTIAPVDAAQRTICFEEDMKENHPFFVEYEYLCKADYIPLYDEVGQDDSSRLCGDIRETSYPSSGNAAAVSYAEAQGFRDPGCDEPMDKDHLDDFYKNVYEEDLAEYPPHILFTPFMKALEAEITKGLHGDLEKARAIYDYVTMNVEYSYMRSYFTIENLSEIAAIGRKGDCGIQALMFMTLARIAGIPTRWQSGLDTNPYDTGSHDWAMAYLKPYGWVFIDPSFGGGAYRNGHEKERQFYFGNLDPFRTPCNREFQRDFEPAAKFLRLDPYDNQSAEAEYDDRKLSRDDLTIRRSVVDYECL